MQNLLKIKKKKKKRKSCNLRFFSISFLGSFYKISSILNILFLKNFLTSRKIFRGIPDFLKIFSKIVENLRWFLRNCCTLSIFSALTPPPSPSHLHTAYFSEISIHLCHNEWMLTSEKCKMETCKRRKWGCRKWYTGE